MEAPQRFGSPVTSTQATYPLAKFNLFFPYHVPRAANAWPAATYSNMADTHLSANGQSRPGTVRHPTAPSMMMNSHFAGVGDNVDKEAYGHGIQVVDEEKVFKYVQSSFGIMQCGGVANMAAATTSLHISALRKSYPPASTTTSYLSSDRNRRANPRCSITSSALSLASWPSRSAGRPPRAYG